jgi:putative transposase
LDYEKSRAAAKSRIANLKIAALRRRKSPRQVQRFLSVHDQVANLFPRRRDHDTAANIRSGRTRAFATWTDVTGVTMAA